ncbi:MAG: GIY-YIG nuclease family protein [Christensenellales bacterium]
MKNYYVYIITNKSNSTLYVGVTNNLQRRLFEHKNKLVDGFSKRYNLNKLLYYEETSDINSAIEREKQIKSYSRAKKDSLIFCQNPTKLNLSEN